MGKNTHIAKLSLGLIIILACVNFIAVLGPELGFDALWYHLTLPQLFINTHRWFFDGGLLYYSAMPRLAETLFIPLLQLCGTSGPKFFQFASGLITVYFVYQIAREFYDRNRSLLGALLFYSTWLVSWQSGSAYVDLIRTMFETVALYFALKDKKIFAGIALGLAIGVKWHALGTMLIFGAFISPIIIPIALITASPWFFLAWKFTGNPVFPLFQSLTTVTQLSQVDPGFFGLFSVLRRFVSIPISLIFTIDDFLNPLLSPLFFLGAFFVLKKSNYRLKSVLIVSLLGLISWQLTPPPSARYLLPFLPAITIIALSTLDYHRLNKAITSAIIAAAIALIFLRATTNSKYLPVLTGQVSTNQFLTQNSAKLPGTIIDSDNWIANNLPPDASILVENWHNLYYLRGNYTHDSWATPDQKFDYLLTKGRDLKTVSGQLLHTNQIGVQIFKL